jgi:putative ABC transport system ATP-binding protein
LSGLVDVDCGSILIDNKEITQFSQDEMTKFRGKNMSFIFQQFHLIPNLTVEENIELVCEMNDTESQFTVDELLEKV